MKHFDFAAVRSLRGLLIRRRCLRISNPVVVYNYTNEKLVMRQNLPAMLSDRFCFSWKLIYPETA